jgi:uncharacterized protein (UPF0333 family)
MFNIYNIICICGRLIPGNKIAKLNNQKLSIHENYIPRKLAYNAVQHMYKITRIETFMDHQFSHFHGFNFHGCWGEG